ncbi:MAG TPA: hypothetical protein DCM05_07495, partial [Elusimicrobia bacterium]|nr:hypothetical protein [Elusimicrobiota bacterium]
MTCGAPLKRGAPQSFLLLLLLALPARPEGDYRLELRERARALSLHERRPWRLLLHFRGADQESEADGPGFFLSPLGRRDPRAELEADLEAFFSPPLTIEEDDAHQHPQCRFPARYAWLKAELGFDPVRLVEQPCARFKAWRGDPEYLTLVYADAFLSNPSSMYGHTFLRLNERNRPDDEKLLDYTLNFSADTDETNGILFAVNGLTGRYRGKFSTMPYYMKVQEYSNIESRDLWEYRLALSSTALDRLMMHVWELGSTWFDYYFFSENCSYQLLPLLDAAEPSLRLTERVSYFVIPSDTLRHVLSVPGLVQGARYRPSRVSEMLSRRGRLSRDEARAATLIGRRAEEASFSGLEGLSPERQAAVLDSAYDLLRYRAGFKETDEPGVARAERLILTRRSRLGAAAALEAKAPARPEEGHRTARAGAAVGVSEDGPFGELGWRGSLQDTLALQDGYVPDSLLEMFGLRLRSEGRQGLYLHSADFVNITSFTPLDPWIRKPSWRLSSGFRQAEELGCRGNGCVLFGFDFGVGASLKPDWPARPLFYAFAELDTGVGGPLEKLARAGGGGAAGAGAAPGP